MALATMASVSALVALGVGFRGYRSTPPRPDPAKALLADPGNPADKDPLAPRLFDQSAPVRVHIAGAVRKPGVYTVASWSRVDDAVKKAGGATPAADLDAINLADRVRDGEQIRIPVRGSPAALDSHRPTPEPRPVPPTVGGRGMGRYPFASAGGGAEPELQPASAAAINLNSASREDLDKLPGVGPATAERILNYRAARGPFLRPEDLMNVEGIGPAKFEKLRPLVAAP